MKSEDLVRGKARRILAGEIKNVIKSNVGKFRREMDNKMEDLKRKYKEG